MIEQEQFWQEAERLRLIPIEDQAAVVAINRDLASSPLATPACRTYNRERAKALEKLLGIGHARKPAKPRASKNQDRDQRKRVNGASNHASS